MVAMTAVLLGGCISPSKRPAENKPLVMRRSQATLNKGQYGHGLQFRKEVDAQGNERRVYIFVPRGIPKTMLEAMDQLKPDKVLEMAQAAKDSDHPTALFGAQWVSRTYPVSRRWAPSALMLEGEVMEAQKLYNYAFDIYQKFIERWPENELRHEVLERQLRLADRFMKGARFKWRLPFQETVYLPMPHWLTRGRTAKMYTDVVKNSPYGPLAAEAQFKEGLAYHKDLDSLGVFGMFITQRQLFQDIERTVGAYQLTADRYGRRETIGQGITERVVTADEKVDRVFKALDTDGDNRLTRELNPGVFKWHGFSTVELEDDVVTREEMVASLRRQEAMVAQARFNIGRVFQDQASDGLYDQTMAEKSQDAYGVFLKYYGVLTGESKYAPRGGFEGEWFQEHVTEAQKRIDLMRLEQGRGYLAIAEFYVERANWVAAEKYYSKVGDVVQKVTEDSLIETRKRMLDQAGEGSKAMRIRSITDGVQAYEAARTMELDYAYPAALRLYRRALVALKVNEGDIEEFGASEAIKQAAREYGQRVDEDVARIEAVMDRVLDAVLTPEAPAAPPEKGGY